MTEVMSSHEKIKNHLMAQKAQSVTVGGVCQYRYGSLMCAVGCLIPDEKYEGDMECKVVAALVERWPYLLPEDIETQALESWQRYHDNSLCVPHLNQYYSYQRWIQTGDEEHSPETVAKIIAEKYRVH
ncbi:hypothetical protein D3C78_914170 [compost metagenome]